MGIAQVVALVVGAGALVVGLKAILTQKISIDWNADDEADHWVYGWRAIAVGGICLLVSGFLFAGATGLIPLSLDWHD